MNLSMEFGSDSMPKKITYYNEIAQDMIKADKDRNNANLAYDAMDHNQWQRPSTLENILWIREDTAPGPPPDIAAGLRVLSALQENITIQPLASNQATKEKVNEWERSLAWVMAQANRRRQGTVRQSVVKSAIKYDEVCAQVIDLDYQIAQKNIFEGNTNREKAARRHYGRFVEVTCHPNDVHVRYSNLMPEAVLLCQKRKAQEVLDEWGKQVYRKGNLRDWAKNGDDVYYFDLTDYEDHAIWCSLDKEGESSLVEVINDKHNLPWLPWVCRGGGDTMEYEAIHRRRPMLYGDYTSNKWENSNVIRTVNTSDVIRKLISPRFSEEGPIPVENRKTFVDYGPDASNPIVQVTPGNTLRPLLPPSIDTAALQIQDRLAAERAQGTLSSILKGGELPAGTSFAALNLGTLIATGALKPPKEVSELAIADIYSHFVYWAHHTKNSIKGYAKGGEQYSIEWDEIDPENFYIECELKPDVALDRQQRANVAMMLVQAGLMSKEKALEYMGENDPTAILKQVHFEQLVDNRINLIMQREQLQLQMEAQQMTMQQQQQMADEQAYQQQAMAAQQGQMAGAPGGEMFNPAQGGLPAQMGAPGATREGVTGEDVMGNEAMMGMGGL